MKNGLYLSNGYMSDMLVIDERLTDLENMLDSVLDRLSKRQTTATPTKCLKRTKLNGNHQKFKLKA